MTNSLRPSAAAQTVTHLSGVARRTTEVEPGALQQSDDTEDPVSSHLETGYRPLQQVRGVTNPTPSAAQRLELMPNATLVFGLIRAKHKTYRMFTKLAFREVICFDFNFLIDCDKMQEGWGLTSINCHRTPLPQKGCSQGGYRIQPRVLRPQTQQNLSSNRINFQRYGP